MMNFSKPPALFFRYLHNTARSPAPCFYWILRTPTNFIFFPRPTCFYKIISLPTIKKNVPHHSFRIIYNSRNLTSPRFENLILRTPPQGVICWCTVKCGKANVFIVFNRKPAFRIIIFLLQLAVQKRSIQPPMRRA